jgi:hypothetical protein
MTVHKKKKREMRLKLFLKRSSDVKRYTDKIQEIISRKIENINVVWFLFCYNKKSPKSR